MAKLTLEEKKKMEKFEKRTIEVSNENFDWCWVSIYSVNEKQLILSTPDNNHSLLSVLWHFNQSSPSSISIPYHVCNRYSDIAVELYVEFRSSEPDESFNKFNISFIDFKNETLTEYIASGNIACKCILEYERYIEKRKNERLIYELRDKVGIR